ncbi:MAG: DASH family cryptochrome [Flavobacteriia bacterium]|nr:DASH family cryptochrome [Flavobacteriia bacterium]OIP46198.1 MAG: deoxyribodipyrimidine photolyase [Flavobacteriaceae bacterium CG2_30_31_66]PIV96855.1 MAG: DASH family cryptochrome [Flavobacteriaceae bacterium CG17_big_fil_post_rev_8_21_14_2_50_31_13]PIX14672.1 MAG: DASH family cryptochrome [Flavobacteriaceae bacterium CG_4_8_14_3_um_filter_31_8]PIY15683.1 MAG: DASH family cryptochrome [Flavobacteriaceae bacterium CG_4_10_14_3_um_filter_31_253]PIZ09524.1 MAG: DASH family cryptochrome [Fla
MQKKQNNTSVIWFRNNLRTLDNTSLFKAIHHHEKAIAVYFFDPKYFEIDTFGFKKTEKFRAKFLIETITDLKRNLADLNITLLTYFKNPEDKLPKICEEFSVETIYTQKEWTDEELQTNHLLKKALPNVKFIEDFDQFLYHPNVVSNDYSKIPDVFTNFRKGVEKKVRIEAEISVSKVNETNLIDNNTKIPTLEDLGFEDFSTNRNTAFPFKGGETEALKRVNYYLFETKKVSVYKNTRNGLVGIDYSTKFSPWLANGSLSAKTIYWRIKQYEKEFGSNESTYWVIFELIWRDYFKFISLKYGSKIFQIEGILDVKYHWNNNSKAISQWIQGKTKDNFVNANMIELKETGWMSNRGRQNVASYFAKELLLDWRIGAAYFESILLDYDVHSNYGNWMYVSGVGNDPRDRKFNTQFQAQNYDGNYKFRNLWLEKTLF